MQYVADDVFLDEFIGERDIKLFGHYFIDRGGEHTDTLVNTFVISRGGAGVISNGGGSEIFCFMYGDFQGDVFFPGQLHKSYSATGSGRSSSNDTDACLRFSFWKSMIYFVDIYFFTG